MPINIVCHGILSRTVRDTAAFYTAAEKYFLNPELTEIGLVKHPGKQRLRIALITNAPYFSPDNYSSVTHVIEAGKVCEGLGHKVEEIPFPFQTQVMEGFIYLLGCTGIFVSSFWEKNCRKYNR